MAKGRRETELKKVLIGILIAVLAYFVLGTFFNYLGMKLYFSNGIYTLGNGDEKFDLKFVLKNNNAISLPFNNPLFYYKAEIIEGNISCKTGDYNCKDNLLLDIGKINAGEDRSILFQINPYKENNFTVMIKTYINTFNVGILYKSKRVGCFITNSSVSWEQKYNCSETI